MPTFLRTLAVTAATLLLQLTLAAGGMAQQAATQRSVCVIAYKADVMSGSKVIATVETGKRLFIQRTSGKWYLITLYLEGNQKKEGWIRRDHVLLEPAISAEDRKKVIKAGDLYGSSLQSFKKRQYKEALLAAQESLAILQNVHGQQHPHTASCLESVAAVYEAMGDNAKALPLHQQTLGIRKKVLGEQHPDTASSLNKLAELYQAMGHDAKALPLAQQALEIRKKVLGEWHSATALSLNNLAVLYRLIGDYAKALPLQRQALEIRKKHFGERHATTANSLSSLGLLYQAMGDYAKALPLQQQALEIRKKHFGEQHATTANSRRNLAFLYEAMGDYRKALPLYQQALEIDKKVLGELHPSTAGSLNRLASFYERVGAYAKALPLYLKALEIRKKVLGEEHPLTAQSLSDLASLYRSVGNYGSALPLCSQALEIYRGVLGEQHPSTASALGDLALVYQDMGNFGKALSLQKQALEIDKKVLGDQHPSTATALSNLAAMYDYLGDIDKALPLYLRALDIREKVLGKGHPDTADNLDKLAGLCVSAGEYATALPFYQRALQVRMTVLGAEHPDTAQTLNNLASLYRAKGEHATAIPLQEQALEICKKRLGEQHPRTATSISNLAGLHAKLGNDAKSLELYQQVLGIREKVLGEQHPDTADCLLNLAVSHWFTGDDSKASQRFRESRRTVRRHVARVLPGLTKREQLVFLKRSYAPAFFACLSYAYDRRENPRIRSLAAGWLLNGKAVSLEALAKQSLLMRQATDAAAAGKVRLLNRLRAQLAMLSLRVPAPSQQEEHERTLATLHGQEQKVLRELRDLGIAVDERRDPWVALEDARLALPEDGLLIEVARFRVTDPKARGAWQAARYVAWLIPPAGKGEVRMVDLGEAAPIEEAIAVARKALADSPQMIRKQGEPEAEKEGVASLQPLARLVWQPLAAELGDAKQLILSPDGALWLVPWGALPVENGKYAIEKYHIRYVVSGRDLVPPAKASKTATTSPLLMADPDYDLGPEQVKAQTRSLVRGTQLELLSAGRGLGSRSRLPIVPRLPGTAAEAQAIAPSVESYTRAQPRLFTDKRAVEGVFKAARSPSIVVLSTHGFFLKDQEAKQQRGGKLEENPLLRCGLMLAGCNQRDEAAETGVDDGVLTGLEIVGTDLRGTELVVLSACETGIGEVRNGEGVAGLRQAFQLAGAESVMATLWQIPDRETARLMNDFFGNLAGGMDRATALRQAQLTRIQARRERNGAAHPFFWAAFTLTGQDIETQAELRSAREYYERGKKFARYYSYDRALADFNAALKLDANLAAAHSGRGGIFRARRDLDRAIASFTEAIRLDPGNARFYRNRAKAYGDRKQFAEALADLDKAVASDQGVDSLVWRAYVHRQMRNPDKAKADCEAALAQAPKSALAWTEKGIQAVLVKRIDEATDAFNKALEFDPRFFGALYQRSHLYLRQNKLDDALKDLEVAVRVSPRYVPARLDLARIHARQGRRAAAIRESREAVRLAPKSARAHEELGDHLRMAGQMSEAIEHLDEAIRLNPRSVTAYGFRGSARRGTGDFAGAEADILKALELAPRYAFGLTELGRIRLYQKRLDEAIDTLSKAIKLTPNLAYVYQIRARAYRQKGDEARAKADEAKARQLGNGTK